MKGLLSLLKLKFKKRPEPKFNLGEWVVYNWFGNLGDKYDELCLVEFREFVRPGGADQIKRWHYDGSKFKLEKTTSEGLPYIPLSTTPVFGVSEEKLYKLDEIIKNKLNAQT